MIYRFTLNQEGRKLPCSKENLFTAWSLIKEQGTSIALLELAVVYRERVGGGKC